MSRFLVLLRRAPSLAAAHLGLVRFHRSLVNISFDQHVELCRYFRVDRLKQLVADEADVIERDVLLTSTFFILDTVVKADYLRTLKWGEYYLDYLRSYPELPAEQRIPRSDVLKRMAIIYDSCDILDLALRICDVADSYGIQEDGTRGGFLRRRKRLEARRKALAK